MGTHSEECGHKPTNRKAPCLICHLKMKRKIKIRDSYRGVKGKRKQDENFDALEKRLKKVVGVEIEKFPIGKDEYGIILFDDKKTLKEVIKSENCGFFGDRPAMYLFCHDGEERYVGESRNSFQRLNNHLREKEISNGGIVINTTKEKMWPDDPLNGTNVRLVLERMLKHLVHIHNKKNTKIGVDKWVACTEKELDTAIELASEIYLCATNSKSTCWDNLVNTKEPLWTPNEVPAWY